MLMLKPNQPAPPLSVDTVGGGAWSLADQTPDSFTMIVFYRGLFCGICQDYLGSLVELADDFADRGVIAAAISMDSAQNAEAAVRDWRLGELTVGYGLSRDEAATWGLHLGTRLDDANQEYVFNQPGLFLIQPDQSIYAAFVQTSEFARPSFKQVLTAIDFQRPD